jgi:anhydro-N-acetylmuramic acid kinase
MKHPFLQQTPPKSTGREQFGHFYADEIFEQACKLGLSGVDAIATATAFTARSIGQAYRLSCNGTNNMPYPDRVIVSGGGAANATLMRMLQKELFPAIVSRAGDGNEDVGISSVSSDSKEAVAFALFAYQAVLG